MKRALCFAFLSVRVSFAAASPLRPSLFQSHRHKRTHTQKHTHTYSLFPSASSSLSLSLSLSPSTRRVLFRPSLHCPFPLPLFLFISVQLRTWLQEARVALRARHSPCEPLLLREVPHGGRPSNCTGPSPTFCSAASLLDCLSTAVAAEQAGPSCDQPRSSLASLGPFWRRSALLLSEAHLPAGHHSRDSHPP